MKNLFSVFFVLLIAVSCQTHLEQKASTPVKQIKETQEVEIKNENKDNNFTKKYGLEFVKPETWKTDFEDNKSINLKGEIMALETDYSDKNANKIRFVLHLGDRGRAIYDSKIKSLQNDGKFIKIGDKQAIETTQIIRFDGKGHPIKPPKTRKIISVLTQQGEVDVIYDTKSSDDIKAYNIFLSKLRIKE